MTTDETPRAKPDRQVAMSDVERIRNRCQVATFATSRCLPRVDTACPMCQIADEFDRLTETVRRLQSLPQQIDALIADWRAKARVHSQVSFGAQCWVEARRECANELEALAVLPVQGARGK